ncbi:MAG: hypothetical protein D3904_03455 [Candidatus Electrothrix sp. EH2]|nr:hypothetical protein [Candidatus Electrothrix sp. EH2]
MNSTKLDFEQRKQEVETYFSFLVILEDDENTRLKYKKGETIVKERVSGLLQKILIANGFLLLYNLIEATVRNSILEIYYEIQDSNINFEMLSDRLKKIWIKQETDKLKEGTFKQDTLRNQVLDIAESVLKKESIALSRENLDFSGNLDAQKIRELSRKFGFSRPQDGRNLVTIKNKRNRLAHGEATFSEIGRDYTVGELTSFKDETLIFLDEVISKIEHFISHKKYIVGS